MSLYITDESGKLHKIAGVGGSGGGTINGVTLDTDQTITGKKTFEADTQITPNENTEFSVTDKLVQQRVVGNGVSLFQVNDNGTSAIKYAQDIQKTSGISVAGDGISLLSSGNDFENNVTLNEDGFKYNNSSVVTENNETIKFAESERQKSKNLFDKDNALIYNAYVQSSNKFIYASVARSVILNIKPNTTYTISKIKSARFIVGTSVLNPETDIDITQNKAIYESDSPNSITITSGANDKYLLIFCYHTTDDTVSLQAVLDSLQVEYGDVATDYQPYYGEIVHEKDVQRHIITGTTIASFKVTTASTASSSVYETVPLVEYSKIGNKLTMNSDGGVVIGSGVAYVKVNMSSNLYINVVGYHRFRITKNGSAVAFCYEQTKDSNYRSILVSMSSFLIKVNEGDVIELKYSDTSTSNAIQVYELSTHMTVEVVE